MIGRTIAHFEVLEKLGEGGMGVVYKARDQHLDRFVALKVLQPEAVAKPDRRRRFVQEAKSASALNHPNIVHIYDIGESDGSLFIAMEYVTGQTLDQLIRGCDLTLQQALRASVQIADALGTAHAAGIVHRDLKPSNIMITGQGLVKVLDFGLAKLLELDSDADPSVETLSMQAKEPRTEEGAILGTAAYMSPEQAEGKKVDARSDIFSFGAVLYEMLTGRRAFSGPSRIATLSAVMRDEPSSLIQSAPGIPAELERIVQRCLRKDPARRSQNMADVKVQLEEIREESSTSAPAPVSTPASTLPSAISSAEPPPQPRAIPRWAIAALIVLLAIGTSFYFWRSRSAQPIDSLAVLPFTNVGADPNTEYLSEGVTDGLTNTLAQLPNLKVASRNSASRIKDSDVKRASSELGVRAVLIGKIRQQGNTLAISVELVDSKDNTQIWGEHYDRKLPDLVAVQQEITNDIADKLQRKLSGQDRQQLAKRYSTNTEAYQLYLKGRYQSEKMTKEGVLQGIESFRKAINADPAFALAYEGMSYAYFTGADFLWPASEIMPRAKEAARKALELDDTLAEAHLDMAIVDFWYDFNWKEAEKEFRRAIELKDSYADSHGFYGWYLLTVGRREEGVAESRKAAKLDPLSSETNVTVAQNMYMAHQYDEAVEVLRKIIERDPDYFFARMLLGFTYEAKGDLPKAIAELQQARKIEPSLQYTLAGLAHTSALAGRRGEADQYLKEMQDWEHRSFFPAYNFAEVYAGRGDKQLALTYIEKAYEDRSMLLTFLLTEQELDPLRNEPRFKEVLRKMGLQP